MQHVASASPVQWCASLQTGTDSSLFPNVPGSPVGSRPHAKEKESAQLRLSPFPLDLFTVSPMREIVLL